MAADPKTTGSLCLMPPASRPPCPTTTRLAAAAMPDYTKLISSWVATASSTTRVDLHELTTLEVVSRIVAEDLLIDATSEAVRSDPAWMTAANAWINRNAVPLALYLIFGVVIILFAQINAVAPDLLDDLNRVLATPLVLAGLVLAVYKRPN